MANTNINLSKDDARSITKELNSLLASYAVTMQNVWGFHWNIQGKEFFEKHKLLGKIYTDFQGVMDSLAERVRQLENEPVHTYKDFIEGSFITIRASVKDFPTMNDIILIDLQRLLEKQKSIATLSNSLKDIVTNNIMINLSEDLEKRIWMHSMYK